MMNRPRLDKEQWQQVLPLLDRVLELTDADREELLTRLDGEQPSIASSLRALLEEQNEIKAQHFLESAPAPSMTQESMHGQMFGAYAIESLIGRGGMGEVWLAQRNDGRFERKVAVKLMNAALLSQRAHERFEQEGRLLARLTHPNIARLMDAGVTAGNRPYIVLEYVEGEPIDRYCDARSLSIETRLRLYLDVLAAVTHAQNNLIVHRDLKPSNVLVTNDGVVKLLDFGIAKVVGDGIATDAEALTRFGESALTPEYAAPEQILGEPVSTATDVYQLGVLLYMLLAGSHPYAHSTTNRRELIRIALETDPPRMSEALTRSDSRDDESAAARAQRRAATSHRLRAVLRGDLDAIIAKTLRKEVAERYSSAAALAEDLRRYLDHRPVAAREGAFRYRATKFVRRHRGTLLSTSAVALGLIVTTAFALIQTWEARIQRDEARFQAKRADAERRFMTLMMAEVGPGGKPASLEQILDKGLILLDKQYGNEPEFVVAMLIGLSGRYMDLGNTRKEHAALVKAEAIARKLGPESLAKVQCNTVETEIALGDMQAAAARLAEGRAAIASVSRPHFRTTADCLRARATLSEAQGRTEEGIRYAEDAARILEEANDTRSIQYTGILSQIETMYGAVGDVRKAIEVNRRSQAAFEQAGRAGTLGMLGALHNEAANLADVGQIADALARQRDVVNRSTSEDSGTPLHPAVSRLYGELLLRMGEPTEALRWFDDSLGGWREQGAIPPQIIVGAQRSSALLALGRPDDALAEFPDLSVLEGEKDNASRRARVRAGISRAGLLLARNEIVEARTQIDSVLMDVRGANELVRWQLPALITAARIAMASGSNADTVRYATEALQIAERRALEPDHSADVGESLLILAMAQRAAADERAAQTTARRAHESLRNALGAEHSLTRAAGAMIGTPAPK